MDLKKYFTDEELNNIRPRIIRQFSSKDKLNDGFGVRDYNADNHWRDCDEEFSLLGKKTILILPGSGAQSAKQANGMCKTNCAILSIFPSLQIFYCLCTGISS